MDKNSYALGMNIAHSMMQSGITRLQYEDFLSGLKDSLEGEKTVLSLEEAGKVLQDYFAHLEAEKAAENAEIADAMKKEGEEFLAANAKEAGVKVLPSGLQYKVLKEGNGPLPKDTSMVKVHYEGKTIDGEVFDSSYKKGQPVDLRANQVIKGFTEALVHMPVGSVWEVYIPQDMAYGERQAGQIKPFSALTFKIELLGIK